MNGSIDVALLSAREHEVHTLDLLDGASQYTNAAGDLAARMAAVRGAAASEDGEVRVTVDVHGALTDLVLGDDARAMGPQRLGDEIVRLIEVACTAALADGVAVLSRVLGDRGTAQLAEALGLGDRIEEAPDEPEDTDPVPATFAQPVAQAPVRSVREDDPEDMSTISSWAL